ncbi:MAG: hypothetical protein ACRDGE_01670 [Candidatus Limnocylindria bacterium]
MNARAALGAILAALILGSGTAPALASCAPPRPAAENAADADAVVHGRVVELRGGPPGALGGVGAAELVVAVERVFKGEVGATIVVRVGPGDGAATSVDYIAGFGTEHVLYLTGGDGGWTTNICTGSHEGPPTPEETAAFGTGAPPLPGSEAGAALGEPLLALAATLGATLFAVGAVFYALGGRRRAAPA